MDIVKACVVLHNFVPGRDGCKFADAVTVTGLEGVRVGQPVHRGLSANSVRNYVADYFLTYWSCSLANVKNMNSRIRKIKKKSFMNLS